MKSTLILGGMLLFWGNAFSQPSKEFKKHWFDGRAEISSYELTHSRYGELRKGNAILIYVTEDFLTEEQVKANQKSDKTVPVIKSNRTKSFLTGIYPYHIMSSTFTSLKKAHPLIKTSASVQEWCGQSYLQLNHRPPYFQLTSHSYFEGEADEQICIAQTVTEDELWNLVRLGPENLPTGNFLLLPALEDLRMDHLPLQAVPATGQLDKGKYTLKVPSHSRVFTLYFLEEFPFTIQGWENQYTHKGTQYSSSAQRTHTQRRAYWKENNNASQALRKPFKINAL